MKTKQPITAELIHPNRSHHLTEANGRARASDPGPFDKEELHPILRVSGVPRVGTVRAEVSADRYVYSTWDDDDPRAKRNVLGEWRVYLRDVRADAPDNAYTSEPAAGVGPATRELIAEAACTVVREYLATDDYRASRRHAAARAVGRSVKEAAGRGAYAFDSVRDLIDAAAAYEELTPVDLSTLKTASERLRAALADVETVTNS